METKPLELDEKSKKYFLAVLSQCRTVLNSYDDSGLAEPWLSHYRKIKNDYDSALKELAPSDQAVAALDAHHHLSCLYSLLTSANAMCSMLGNHMADMKKGAATALNSAVEAAVAERISKGDLISKAELDNRVNAEIGNRTKAGDLVTKEQHNQLCSAAKDMGIQEGRTSAEKAAKEERERLAVIDKRKTSLATNGFPLPADDGLLAGTDSEFETRHATAKSRMDALMGKGVVLNSAHNFWQNIWLPEDKYKTFEGLVEGMAASEPFAKGSSRASKEPTGPMFV